MVPSRVLVVLFYALETRHSGMIFHEYLVVTPYKNFLLGSPTNRYQGANKSIDDDSLVRMF